MQKVFSVLLATLCLLIGFQQALKFAHFKLNQASIEETLCVNKNQPELQCHGSCYLKKELQKSKNSKSTASSIYKQIDLITTPLFVFETGQEQASIRTKIIDFYIKHYTAPQLEINIPPPILRHNLL